MSQLSRQLNAFCRKNPTADTCKSIDFAMPYFSFFLMIFGIIGAIWLLFIAKEKGIKGFGKYGLIEKLAFSSIPVFLVVMGYQGIADPNGNSNNIFYPFVLAIPALVKNWKEVFKWLNELK